MKKALKIIGIVFLVLVIIAGSLAVWQWDNIKGVYVGLTESAEEIEQRRLINQEKLVGDINSYLDEPIREMTPEEKEKVENGEMNVEDVYSGIFAEKQESIRKDRIENSSLSEKKKDSKASEQKSSSVQKATKDEIISKYMSQLYALQSEYTARAEATVSQAKDYYVSLRKTQDKATARTNAVSRYSSLAKGAEAECNSRFEAIVSSLASELKAIGEDTDIIGTIRSTYQNEKQLKISYYTSKYLN